ncbi:MAG: MarR family winged helix-turn-helix transcriptional regulator [Streptosporangiaceae bacterium]
MGPCRLSDLVRTEQIKQPALTSAVAKLERDGLIERRPDPCDGRASMLSLTADGQSIRPSAERVVSIKAARCGRSGPLVKARRGATAQ